MLKLIKKCDVFGHRITFEMDRESTYSTIEGGVCSMLLYLLIIGLTYYRYTHANLKVIKTE